MYRFLLSRQWLGYLALTAFFATICAGLGLWQMERRNQVTANIARINANYSAEPVDLAQARPWLERFDRSREWTPIRLTGRYLTEDQRVVRNRPLNGQPGYEVVVPLRLNSGETVVIDRGWLPIGDQQAGRPDFVPQPVSGEVTVTGRLRSSEPQLQRGAPRNQLASIDLPGYAADLGYPLLTGSYLQMAHETPAAAENPAAFPQPSIVEGPNLSYSMQWFAFGVLFFIGFGYIAVQQARINREDRETTALCATGQNERSCADSPDDPAQQNAGQEAFIHSPAARVAAAARRASQRQGRRSGRRPSAEEEEDALLDARGFRGGAVLPPDHQFPQH